MTEATHLQVLIRQLPLLMYRPGRSRRSRPELLKSLRRRLQRQTGIRQRRRLASRFLLRALMAADVSLAIPGPEVVLFSMLQTRAKHGVVILKHRRLILKPHTPGVTPLLLMSLLRLRPDLVKVLRIPPQLSQRVHRAPRMQLML